MNCKKCGSILNKEDKFCGVCGNQVEIDNNIENSQNIENNINNQQIDQNYQYQQANNQVPNYNNQNYQNNQVKKDDNETACLICGIMSFFTCWIGIILGIVAIVLGVKTKKVTGKMPAGMICGIISVSIYSLIILVYIFLIAISIAMEI